MLRMLYGIYEVRCNIVGQTLCVGSIHLCVVCPCVNMCVCTSVYMKYDSNKVG